MAQEVKFLTNELGNMRVVDKDGNVPENFIKHLEIFMDGADIINLNVTEEEYSATNHVYFHINHPAKINIGVTIKQLYTVFNGREIYYETAKHKSKLVIINLFLFK